jgi:hypothetical protein
MTPCPPTPAITMLNSFISFSPYRKSKKWNEKSYTQLQKLAEPFEIYNKKEANEKVKLNNNSTCKKNKDSK